MFYANERIALFIDGANLSATSRALELEIDFKRLRDFFQTEGRLLRCYYYTAVIDHQYGEHDSLRPLLDWLTYNGYHLVTKFAKQYTDNGGKVVTKGNMDVEIAVEAMELAPHLDHLVLFSGDGDFRRLVESLQRQGVRVTVVSTFKSNPSMIADELRRQADVFIDMEEIRSHIKNIKARATKDE